MTTRDIPLLTDSRHQASAAAQPKLTLQFCLTASPGLRVTANPALDRSATFNACAALLDVDRVASRNERSV